MYYYVTKTGLQTFDACRAYGLALLLERLALSVDASEDVTIHDVGPFYRIFGPSINELDQTLPQNVLDDLLVVTNGWCAAFLTTGRTPESENLRPPSRKRLEGKIADIQSIFGNLKKLLSVLTEPIAIDLISSKGKERESIPASLDPAASKGHRRAKRDSYSEGEQLFVPREHAAIGAFGGAHFIRWTWTGGGLTALLPLPQRVTIHDHRSVKAISDSNYLCRCSDIAAAAHYAVQLADALRRRVNGSKYSDQYSALAIHSMAFSGNQWKAQSGGLFPLDYLIELLRGNQSISADIFNLWNYLFRWGSVRGNEILAITLADFLAQPSIENLVRYVSIHLRMTLTDPKRRQFAPYHERWMQEVLQHVR